jgi:hypothetical protein
MIVIRKSYPLFGLGRLSWIETDNVSLAGYWREYLGNRVLILNNLSASKISVRFKTTDGLEFVDLFSGERCELKYGEGVALELEPFSYRWLESIGLSEATVAEVVVEH